MNEVREDLLDVVAGLGSVRELAAAKAIAPREAAKMVAAKLGWENGRIPAGWIDSIQPAEASSHEEERAYRAAKAISGAAKALRTEGAA